MKTIERGGETYYEHRGYEIRRVVSVYFGKREISFFFNGTYYVRLKDAVAFIDDCLDRQQKEVK